MAREIKWATKFGHPVPRSTGVSQAYWAKSTTSPYPQKGSGWQILLNGGVQSGSNWAGIFIPVDELPLTLFNKRTLWSYYMSGTETMGVNIVFWVHDPTDLDKRAEITQLGSISGLAKTSGWNAHALNTSTDQFFFYGEGTTGTDLTAGPPNYYGLDDFQGDVLFRSWTIYRISLEYGWEASGTFDPAWVADIILNDEKITLRPTEDELAAPVFQYHTGAAALATALSPKTPFRLERIELHLNAAATQENFTVSIDAGRGTVYDVNLVTEAMSGIQDDIWSFGVGYEYQEGDEIDCTWTNTDTMTYGLTYVFRVMP